LNHLIKHSYLNLHIPLIYLLKWNTLHHLNTTKLKPKMHISSVLVAVMATLFAATDARPTDAQPAQALEARFNDCYLFCAMMDVCGDNEVSYPWCCCASPI
jgi:hypothetical protein